MFNVDNVTNFSRLTGVLCQPKAHEKLEYLYSKILRLSDKLPLNYPYKQYVEEIVCYRKNIVKECGVKHYKIEECCNAKVEIMISQAENELQLVRTLLTYKAWDTMIRPPPGQWQWPPIIK